MVTGWWYSRHRDPLGLPVRLVTVQSDEHPDGAIVDSAGGELPQGWCAVAEFEDRAVVSLRLSDRLTPDGLPLWFAEFRESTAQPPAVSLVAFSGHGQQVGRLVDQDYLSNVAVRHEDQIGAVRWYPATGEVDQIYVDPAHRRRGVAGAVLHAAAMLSVARGWKRFWGDGQRTELGEKLRNSSNWAHRAADLTHIAPPMTPGSPQ